MQGKKVQELLKESAGTIRLLVEERDSALAKLAAYVRREEAAKVAHAMHDKGIRTDTPVALLTVELEKAAEQGKLSTIREAVELVGPDMGKVAHLSDERVSAGGSSLERFLTGSVG